VNNGLGGFLELTDSGCLLYMHVSEEYLFTPGTPSLISSVKLSGKTRLFPQFLGHRHPRMLQGVQDAPPKNAIFSEGKKER